LGLLLMAQLRLVVGLQLRRVVVALGHWLTQRRLVLVLGDVRDRRGR
jgi:hypothetical protein